MVVIFTTLDASRILMKPETLNLYREPKPTLEKWNSGLVRLFGKGASAIYVSRGLHFLLDQERCFHKDMLQRVARVVLDNCCA